VAEGSLGLEDPVCRWVEGVDRELEVRHLLQHSGGYPAWRPFFEEFSSLKPGSMEVKAAILEAIVQTPLQSRPGIQHCYSDLGFLLLQAVVECCGELSLRELFQKLVQEPAGVELCFGWPGAAATENCPVRGRVMEGEVHDLNAWWLGGVAGHAGLFGPVGEVGKLAEWWLQGFKGENTLLPQSLVARFWQSKGPGSHQLGWDGVTPGASSAGSLWPKDGVGHLGFTGCSLWIAPKQEVIVTLLTNRVHPVVEGGARPGQSGPKTTAFRAWRPRLYTAVWEGLSG
jgi:CubicO group peptidase (beta-lactamase class C family)